MLLSICIPTYNRERYLRSLLESLMPQLDGLPDGEVELLVSDNKSEDGTAKLCRSIVRPFMRFWTNDVNIGGDRNFLKCISEAKGEYVWLVGDDEMAAPGAVARVLDFLRKNRPGLMIADEKASVDGDMFPDYKTLLAARPANFALVHTLISANVFRRDLFDMELAVEKLWVQYAHMFGIMSRMTEQSIGVMSSFVATQPVRAEFAKYPSCLCVKQAVYLWFLAKRLDLPRLRRRAISNACNLPVEYASRVWNFMRRKRG